MDKIVIMVYDNRHYRAKRKDLNDMGKQNYISLRAIQALMKTGSQLQFIREVRTYEDVTAIYEPKILTYQQVKGRNLKNKLLIQDSFDPLTRQV